MPLLPCVDTAVSVVKPPWNQAEASDSHERLGAQGKGTGVKSMMCLNLSFTSSNRTENLG